MLLFGLLLLLLQLASAGRHCEDKDVPNSSGDFCFHVYALPRLSFYDAEEVCNSNQGHLASIHNGFDNSIVSDALRNFAITEATWIGGAKLADSTQWFWLDGLSFDFTRWDNGEPGDETKHVISFTPSSSNWKAAKGEDLHPFVCERPAIVTGEATSSITPPFSPFTLTPSSCIAYNCTAIPLAGNGSCFLLHSQPRCVCPGNFNETNHCYGGGCPSYVSPGNASTGYFWSPGYYSDTFVPGAVSNSSYGSNRNCVWRLYKQYSQNLLSASYLNYFFDSAARLSVASDNEDCIIYSVTNTSRNALSSLNSGLACAVNFVTITFTSGTVVEPPNGFHYFFDFLVEETGSSTEGTM